MTMAASADKEQVYPNRLPITITVMAASSIYALDWTIAVVALPHMQGSFAATQDQISWVLTSYIVLSAVMLPATAWLSAKLGRRNLFICSVAGFTVFSFLCGVANDLTSEVIFRIGQGASGAFLIPLSQSFMLDNYPRDQQAKAMAIWGMGVMLGPIIGPTLGGILTDTYSWRWVFFINAPIGLLAIAGGLIFLPKPPRSEVPRFDWLGFATLTAGIAGLQLILDRGERLDWFTSPEIKLEAGMVIVGISMFLIHASTTERPLVRLMLFRDRNYALGLFFAFVYGLLTLAPMVLMPPFLQDLKGYPITTIGMLLTPRGAGIMLTMMLFGRFGNLIDPRISLTIGFSALAISSWAMSQWNLNVSTLDIVWTGLLQGFGAGAIIVPLGVVAFSTLADEDRTEASAIWNLTRSIGSSIGIAIALAILIRMINVNHAVLGERLNPFRDVFRSTLENQNNLFGDTRSLMLLDLELTRQSALIGYLDVFYYSATASVAVLPFVLLLRPTADGGTSH